MSSSVINWFKYVFEILKLLNILFLHFMSLRLKLDLGEKSERKYSFIKFTFSLAWETAMSSLIIVLRRVSDFFQTLKVFEK